MASSTGSCSPRWGFGVDVTNHIPVYLGERVRLFVEVFTELNQVPPTCPLTDVTATASFNDGSVIYIVHDENVPGEGRGQRYSYLPFVVRKSYTTHTTHGLSMPIDVTVTANVDGQTDTSVLPFSVKVKR